jgi:hypothetical protein
MDDTTFETLDRLDALLDRLDGKLKWLKWMLVLHLVLAALGVLVLGMVLGRMVGILGP